MASWLSKAGSAFPRKSPPPKSTSFEAVVWDKTSHRALHTERFTFSAEADNVAHVKLIHEIGDFFGGGLQFSLMLYPDNSYQVFIMPVPGGKAVESGQTFATQVEVAMAWKNTAYTLAAKRV